MHMCSINRGMANLLPDRMIDCISACLQAQNGAHCSKYLRIEDSHRDFSKLEEAETQK